MEYVDCVPQSSFLGAKEGSSSGGHPAGPHSPATDPMAGEAWDAMGSTDASSA